MTNHILALQVLLMSAAITSAHISLDHANLITLTALNLVKNFNTKIHPKQNRHLTS